MICPSCGCFYRTSLAPGLICTGCWNSSHSNPGSRHRRRVPAEVGEHNDPRPASLRAAESPTIVLVPLVKDDEPSAA
jgi:hypothetical protein